MKKIGLVVLALMLALGALGVGYARWSDTITISGTVNTGSVNINVVQYSGTDIYKMPDDSLFRIHWYTARPEPPEGGLLVSSAVAQPGTEDDTVVVTFDNVFPCQDFIVDWLMQYVGTVPAHINVAWSVDGIPAEWVVVTKNDGMAGYDDSYPLPEPPAVWQMHQDDFGSLYVKIHVPQTPENPNLEAMGQSGTITMTVEAVQWNEQ